MADFDFAKITEVPEIEELQETDTVLAIRDGELYRVASGAVGGVGGYIYEPAENTIIGNETTIAITDDCSEMLETIKAGGPVTLVLPAKTLDDSLPEGEKLHANLVGLTWGDALVETMGCAAYGYIAPNFMVMFTNGATLDTSSVATLSNLRGGGANAVG